MVRQLPILVNKDSLWSLLTRRRAMGLNIASGLVALGANAKVDGFGAGQS
jgi:hypothetical protein